MDEHGRRARLRPREELSLIRRFFAFVLAVGLTAAALFMMFPSWLNAVAAAAPTSPHENTATKTASNTIFVTPAATVTKSPSLGFSLRSRRA